MWQPSLIYSAPIEKSCTRKTKEMNADAGTFCIWNGSQAMWHNSKDFKDKPKMFIE